MQFPTATVVFALAALAVALTAFVATRDNDANAAEVAEPTSGPEMYSIPCTERPPSYTLASRNIVWQQMLHVDPEYRIKIALAGREYMVPWGYFSSRPTPARFNCAPLTAVSLQFWIPDLAAPEGDISVIGVTNRPIEKKRPLSRGYESVIHVFSISGYDEWHDRNRISWAVATRHLDARSPRSEMRFGLWKTVQPVGSLGVTYWYMLGPSEDVVILQGHEEMYC